MERVAWVHGADTEVGQAVALRLAAAGARVLVTGQSERELGACVGEIAHGGGQGRHFVGAVATDAGVAACAAAARARFGRLDAAVIVGPAEQASRIAAAAGVPAIAVTQLDQVEDVVRRAIAALRSDA